MCSFGPQESVELHRSVFAFLSLYSEVMREQDSLFFAIFTDKRGSDTPSSDPKEYVFAGVMGWKQVPR